MWIFIMSLMNLDEKKTIQFMDTKQSPNDQALLIPIPIGDTLIWCIRDFLSSK